MKTIKRIDEKLTHYDDRVTQAEMDVLPTYKRVFLNQLGGSQADNGEEAISFYQLGLKIRSADNHVDLEDAEFKVLKKVCERNAIRLLSHFHAQVLMLLSE